MFSGKRLSNLNLVIHNQRLLSICVILVNYWGLVLFLEHGRKCCRCYANLVTLHLDTTKSVAMMTTHTYYLAKALILPVPCVVGLGVIE